MLLDTDQDELIIEHTNDVPGVLHGVNYPIIINGARVGMIGITGVPSEVQLIARLVRELLQVSISQARKDQEKSYLDQERYMFLFEWLFNQGTKDDHDFEEKGRALGIAVQELLRRLVASNGCTFPAGASFSTQQIEGKLHPVRACKILRVGSGFVLNKARSW